MVEAGEADAVPALTSPTGPRSSSPPPPGCPHLIYRACLATGVVSNTVYCQHAVSEALASRPRPGRWTDLPRRPPRHPAAVRLPDARGHRQRTGTPSTGRRQRRSEVTVDSWVPLHGARSVGPSGAPEAAAPCSRVGTFATRLHGGWWCSTCLSRHRLTCLTLTPSDNWKPEAQAQALELLNEHEQSTWRPFYCPNRTCDGHPHDRLGPGSTPAPTSDPPRWADDWLTLLLSGGRGSGKTRTGSEITHQVTEHTPRVALIAATGPDLRDTMVEGVSGILATSPPGKTPAVGAVEEETDLAQRLHRPRVLRRGARPAPWPPVRLRLGRRARPLAAGRRGLGQHAARAAARGRANPKVVATSTPKPIKWMKDLVADPRTVVHRVSTYENLANLADTFKAHRPGPLRGHPARPSGTARRDPRRRRGRAVELGHVPAGSPKPPPLTRIVVGVDPAGTANKPSPTRPASSSSASAPTRTCTSSPTTPASTPPSGWGDEGQRRVRRRSPPTRSCRRRTTAATWSGYTLENVRATPEPGSSRSTPGAARRSVPNRSSRCTRSTGSFHVGKQGDLAELEDELTTWVPGERLPEPGRRPRARRHRTRQALHARPDRRPQHAAARPALPDPQRPASRLRAVRRFSQD